MDLYFGGDMEAAIALTGQVAGRIESVEPVEPIIREHGGGVPAASAASSASSPESTRMFAHTRAIRATTVPIGWRPWVVWRSPEVPQMAALLEQVKAIARIALYLLGRLPAASSCGRTRRAPRRRPPTSSVASATSSPSVIDKIGEFVKGLTHDTSTPTSPTTP